MKFVKHFALTRNPFSKDLEASDLFVSSSQKEMHLRLDYLLELRGIGLFTGEPGSGKTTAARAVVSRLHKGIFKPLYVPLSTGNVMDMYKTIAWELGLPTERSRAALFRCVRGEVMRLCSESKLQPVLVVDEAHHLRSDVLEDIRLMTNYDMDSKNRLCVVLIGQTELRRRLAMAVHEALAQRIVVTHHLGLLGREEMAAYLAHLLQIAGVERPLFTGPALESIFQGSKGTPRKVNLLAHHALTSAAIERKEMADEEDVRRAVNETV